jgi:hypothetical protein
VRAAFAKGTSLFLSLSLSLSRVLIHALSLSFSDSILRLLYSSFFLSCRSVSSLLVPVAIAITVTAPPVRASHTLSLLRSPSPSPVDRMAYLRSLSRSPSRSLSRPRLRERVRLRRSFSLSRSPMVFHVSINGMKSNGYGFIRNGYGCYKRRLPSRSRPRLRLRSLRPPERERLHNVTV